VNDEPPHSDKKGRDLEKGDDETGHLVRIGVMGRHLGKRRTAGATSADDKTTRPLTADTLVAHEEPCREENAGVAAEPGPEHKMSSSSLSRLPYQNQKALSRKISQTPDTTVNLNLDTDYPVPLYDDYDSDDGNDNEILEVPRGREGRPRMSTKGLPSGSSLVSSPVLGRMAEFPRGLPSTPPRTISPRSSILSPISPSLKTPLPPSPNSPPGSRSRPWTAPSAFTGTATTTISPSPLASAPPSRPGTGDSTGPIRHHRLDSIRSTTVPSRHVQGHRTPPTRDSSPSRSVRFVDYVDGESGHVGLFGGNSNRNDNEGRTVAVVDIPPPLSSRSSSFYNGNGRTLVGSPVEGEEQPAMLASDSVATRVASRPPTR
jgi:hypothetical protein